jgi:hypothetical protein
MVLPPLSSFRGFGGAAESVCSMRVVRMDSVVPIVALRMLPVSALLDTAFAPAGDDRWFIGKPAMAIVRTDDA